jgi:hypothetical protein
MAAAALISSGRAVGSGRLALLIGVLCLLIKFNTLMALSAAKLPFAVPASVPLALIMICGYAASYALYAVVIAARRGKSVPKGGVASLCLALLLGFAPAALLGIPGLVGLAAAVVAGLGLMAFLQFQSSLASDEAPEAAQLTTELAFYLGALASWRFV